MSRLILKGGSGGQVEVKATDSITNNTVILPAANDTLIGTSTTDTLINKTINGTSNNISLDVNNTQLNISVDNLTALKALTKRPSSIILEGRTNPNDGGGGTFVWFAGDSTTPDDALIIQCTSGPSGRYKRLFNGPLYPAWFGTKGDHQYQFRDATITAGSNILTVNVALPNISIGQYIFIDRIGTNGSQFISTVTNVSGTQITLANNAVRGLTARSISIRYGTDDYTALQQMFDASYLNNYSWIIPPGPSGVYLTSQKLIVRQPIDVNSSNIRRVSPPAWSIEDGATIKACAPMTAVIQYGEGSTYDQFIRFGRINGGTIDASFIADDGLSLPCALNSEINNVRIKNIKSHGIRIGASTSISSTGGCRVNDCSTDRDFVYITVTNITNANPAVVTAPDHNLSSNAVICLFGVSGMTQANNKFFKITRIDQDHFSLIGTDSSGWGTFTGSALLNACMPSMRVPWTITGITNASPCVVTLNTITGLSNSTRVEIHAINSVPQLESKTYYIKNVSGQPTKYELYSDISLTTPINSTSYGVYTGGGYMTEYVHYNDMETGLYMEKSSDNKTSNLNFYGIRVGINSGNDSGWGETHIDNHFYLYNDGDIYAHYILGGKSRVIAPYIDGPLRHGFIWNGPYNDVHSVELYYNPQNTWVTYDNYVIMNRFDSPSAGVRMWGGVMEGGIAAGPIPNSRIFADVVGTGDYRPNGIWRTNVTHYPADEMMPAAGGTFYSSVKIIHGGYFYTSYNGAVDTNTIRSGTQYDGVNKSIGFYTSDTFRGSMEDNGVIYWQGAIRTGITTVSSLPAASIGAGCRHFVTDSSQTVSAGLGAIVTGGGSNNVPVYSDGINWRIG